MKTLLRFITLILLATFFSSCSAPEGKATSSLAPSTAASPPENVEQIVAKLEQDWADAIVKSDVGELDRIVADDFIYTNWDGTTMSKTEHLEGIKSKEYKVESINLDNLKVRVFGDAAIVMVEQSEKSQWKGKDNSGRYRFTDIYAKRNGKWQVVAGHGCKVEPPKAK
jgi:ketosteroid isomerase-like protein